MCPTRTAAWFRGRRYSYWLLDQGKQREVLFDSEKDPGELLNIAAKVESIPIIEQHRAWLREYAERNADKRAMDMLTEVQR